MASSLGDIKTAVDLRNVVVSMAKTTVEKLRPAERIGKVYSVDYEKKVAKIYFPGDSIDSLVEARFAADKIPTQAMIETYESAGIEADGDIVRVAGGPGSYYVLDYVSGIPAIDPSARAVILNNTTIINENITEVETASAENAALLDELNTITIPALQNDLFILNSTTIPALETELGNANADITALESVTIPALNTRLTTAESDINAAEADVATLEGKFPITSTSITDGAITTPKMTANAINGDRITANTLNASKIVASSMTTDRFTANSIDGSIVTANTLNASKIVAGTVTTDRMTANSINGDRITASTINGDKVIANTINGDRVIANTINGDRIIANTINGNRIIANTITAAMLTATAIDGKTITGATIIGSTYRSSAGPERVEIDTVNANRISFHSNFQFTPALISNDNTAQDFGELVLEGPRVTAIETTYPNRRALIKIQHSGTYQGGHIELNARTVTVKAVNNFVINAKIDFNNGSQTVMDSVNNNFVIYNVPRNRVLFQNGIGWYSTESTGSIGCDFFAAAYNIWSDARDKSNTKEVVGALDMVRGLTVYDYDTKHGGASTEKGVPDKLVRKRGVMAQDVQKIARHLVHDDTDNPDNGFGLGVDLYGLLATTIAGLKALDAEVQELRKGVKK